MRQLAIRFFTWGLKKLDYRAIHLPREIIVASIGLRSLVLEVEQHPQGGEWKRGQVYGRAIKMYPGMTRYDVGLAIELAVRKMRRG